MTRKSLWVFVALLLVLTVLTPAAAQDELEEPTLRQAAGGISYRGIGLSVAFPFALLPAGSTSAMLFLDLFAQGDLGEHLFHRTEIRFFFDATGFQTTLTSVQESVLIAFTPPPAIFYVGGGLGAFPIRVTGGEDGFLLSLQFKTGIEVQVAPLGLFLDLAYETMPQPFADIDGGTFSPATISALELGFGAMIHF